MPCDKRDVDSAVEYYARSTDPVKMRRMIFMLDFMGDTALADSLMDYAEPPAGTVGVKKVDRSNFTCKVSNFEVRLLLSYFKVTSELLQH